MMRLNFLLKIMVNLITTELGKIINILKNSKKHLKM